MRLGRKIVLSTAAAFALVPAASAMAVDASARIVGTQMEFLAPNNVVQDDAMEVSQNATHFIADDNFPVEPTPGGGCVSGETIVPPAPADTVACPKAGFPPGGPLTSIKVNSNEGNDTITIDNSGVDEVAGVTTELNASVGDDTINGGTVADVINGGGNADVMNGRGGVDEATYSDRSGAVTVKNGDGIEFDGSALDVSINPGLPFTRDDVQASVENVTGGNGDDNLTGNDENNFLDGDDGDDLLTGGKASDNLAGGGGRDRANYADHTLQVFVTIDTPTATNNAFNDGNGVEDVSTAGGTNLDKVRTDVEKVSGTSSNDTLVGQTSENTNNELNGGLGNDALLGVGGNDELFGEQGNDRAFGGSGDDELIGSIGDDLLYGDSGNDVVNGGGNRDQMSGGKGSKDYIKAKDGIRDISIKCGKGRSDKAKVDKRRPKDPKAKGCEKVT